ncbi:uncharacterized protein LOC107403796 isoform X1 [Ziziphus jujuba]|uniref:Uncharacterized protein LOC107403796 isoform X1 n=1 Tax=Ziziphus jujuba TaxID=326968 RepID=A0ABM4ABP0_ZIZJJ|nr:uncharacterized protein LOC107403796 isoform X1 [Ziziphus jujuba]XP_060674152.1 uncharacterized protein LOC107403796 isoform X1 [Ziziphus jujuba]
MKGRSHHRLQNSDPPDDWVNGSWTVDCVCGVNFDDGEEMVNCDECGVWVHTRCSRYVKGDDIFVCDKCKSKNNRNNSEETEVAQLLVELPTKTMRMESAYASSGPPRRPFRLWTDIPIEERVHIQGIPGGDPALFGGLPSVFTPELWKCTGYVPTKFNFQYREFPCWDDKENDSRKDEENENPVDKGAGVLFSLSKESVLATPVAALVSLRGAYDEGACDRKVSLKGIKKWESDDLDVRGAQNGVKKERTLLRSVVVHSGKRKKEDIGTSKDRTSRKKARPAEKEADAKKRSAHSSRTVLTPSSDAKQLEFYEDRGLKFSKTEIQSMKNKNLRDAVVREPLSDGCPAACDNAKKHTSEVPRHDFNMATGQNEEKVDNQHPAVLGSSPKTDDAVATSAEHGDAGNIHVKEEEDKMEINKLDDSSKGPDRIAVKPPLDDMASIAPEVKDNQIQESSGDKSLSSEKLDFEVKTECDGNSRPLLNFQSSPYGDAKDPGIASDHMSEISKLNDTTVSSSQSSDHKAQDIDRSLEAVGDSRRDNADELSSNPCQQKQELEGPENSLSVQKSSSEQRHTFEFPEEHSKPGGIISNLPAVPSQRKLGASVGKSSSTSSTILIAKSSTSSKSADALNSNSIAKQQVIPECNVSSRKDHPSYDVRDEARDDMPRKIVKEHPKSFTNSAPKPSHSGRTHDSASKQTTSESKDSGPFLSSKTSSAPTTAVTSGSSEPAGSLHHQKGVHLHNKNSASNTLQKAEKMNQTSSQPSSKINQNHPSSMCPPAPSSSPATLSDEELALLLHQELNSSPRVPRVPRVRHAGSLPQLASPSATSMLIKRTSSSGGKDHGLVTRRKNKDAPKDGFRNSRELDDEAKRIDRVTISHDQRRQDIAYTGDTCSKGEDDGSATAAQSSKKNIPSTSAGTATSCPSSSTEANDQNLSSIRSSPRNTSDDDTGTLAGPVHRTLPGLINEIMSKGRRMTYEELCNAVLPHWHNLRKHNGERYAYTSHSQAVLDCLRNRHEWARLVDRGPKTNSSRKRRKLDAEELEDNEYGKGKTVNQVESKSLESQREDFPKGKRKARKRRRLALQGRGIKDIRKRRKADMLSDDEIGTSSNSSEESMSSEDEVQGGGACPVGSETSASSDEAGTT